MEIQFPLELALTYIGAGVLLGLSAVGAAVGVGNIGNSFLQGIARQPEMLPMLRIQMFIVLGLVDAVPMIGVGMGLFILFGNPFTPS